MHPDAVEVLVAMGEYAGTYEAFPRESATTAQAALQCSSEIAEHIIQNLMNHGGINFEITPGGELPPTPMAIPMACWYWYVPSAA
jgi:hypothetical protein